MSRIAVRIAVFFVLAVAADALSGRGFAAEEVRRDRYDDPLPKGAIARLGSLRFRYEGGTTALQFSPDGKILAAQVGESILLWDVASGRVRHRLPGVAMTKYWTNRLPFDFSCDSTTLAVLGKDHSIGLWQVSRGELLQRLPLRGKVEEGSQLRFSPDGRSLAVWVERSRVCLLDSITGKTRWQSRNDEKKAIYDLAFSPDGKTLAVCSATRWLELWDATNGAVLRRIDSGDKEWVVTRVTFSADGTTVALTSGKYVLLVKTATGEKLGRLGDSESKSVIGSALTPDGLLLLCCGIDGCIRIWDLKTRKVHGIFQGYVGPHLGVLKPLRVAMALSPDGKTVALGSDATVLYLWDLSTGKAKFPDLQGHDTAIQALAFLPDGKTLISSGDNPPIRFWDAATGRQMRPLPGCADGFRVSPDGKRLVTLNRPPLDPEVPILWDVEKRTRIAQLALEERDQLTSAEIWDAHFTAGGKRLVLAGSGKPDNDSTKEAGLLWIRDGVTGRPLRSFILPGVELSAMAQLADGKTMILGGKDSSILVFDVDKGKTLYTLAGKLDSILSLNLSPTERVLRVMDLSGHVRVWEVFSGRELLSSRRSERGRGFPLRHEPDDRRRVIDTHVYCSVCSPDGRRLATGFDNGSILISDVPSTSHGPHPARPLTGEELRACWTDLADADTGKAYRAIDRLTAAPRQAVTMLQEYLRAIQPPDPKHIHRLLADLDSSSFMKREQATRELEKQIDLVEPFLKKELANRPSLEVRRRMEHLLEAASGPVTDSEQLRLLRSVEALERIGSPEASRVFEELAKGAPEARLTREAKASLERISRR